MVGQPQVRNSRIFPTQIETISNARIVPSAMTHHVLILIKLQHLVVRKQIDGG